MEAQPSFVGADGAVHLDAESAIDLDLSEIIEPRNTEHDDALGLDDAFENAGFPIFRMPLEHQSQRVENLLDSLVEFRLGGILGLHQGEYLFNVIARNSGLGRRQGTCAHSNNLLISTSIRASVSNFTPCDSVLARGSAPPGRNITADSQVLPFGLRRGGLSAGSR